MIQALSTPQGFFTDHQRRFAIDRQDNRSSAATAGNPQERGRVRTALSGVVGAARGHGWPGAPQPDPKPARDGGRRFSPKGLSARALAPPTKPISRAESHYRRRGLVVRPLPVRALLSARRRNLSSTALCSASDSAFFFFAFSWSLSFSPEVALVPHIPTNAMAAIIDGPA